MSEKGEEKVNKAIFLDRDGTLNYDSGYIFKRDELKLLDGVVEALQTFQFYGYILIVVSNQSGIGRGYFSEADCNSFNSALSERLMMEGVKITDFFICPHAPEDNCSCRKPLPTLINMAAEQYDIDLSKSYMFGDKKSDILSGQAAGVKSYLINSENSLLYWSEILSFKKEKNIRKRK